MEENKDATTKLDKVAAREGMHTPLPPKVNDSQTTVHGNRI